jgi:hypothetical protein
MYRQAARTGGYGWPGRGPVEENSRQLLSFLISHLRPLHRVFLARSSDRAGCLYRTSTVLHRERRTISAPKRNNSIRVQEAACLIAAPA